MTLKGACAIILVQRRTPRFFSPMEQKPPLETDANAAKHSERESKGTDRKIFSHSAKALNPLQPMPAQQRQTGSKLSFQEANAILTPKQIKQLNSQPKISFHSRKRPIKLSSNGTPSFSQRETKRPSPNLEKISPRFKELHPRCEYIPNVMTENHNREKNHLNHEEWKQTI